MKRLLRAKRSYEGLKADPTAPPAPPSPPHTVPGPLQTDTFLEPDIPGPLQRTQYCVMWGWGGITHYPASFDLERQEISAERDTALLAEAVFLFDGLAAAY